MSEKTKESTGKELKKAYLQAEIINNFATNCQFCKDLGFELIRGVSIPEHLEVLNDPISGLKKFINLLEEKMSELNKPEEPKQ